MPKYYDIYQDLLNQIQTRQIEPNSYLPSENELVAGYQASRDTVRKALNMLQQNGYIMKEKGRGSRVLDPDVISFELQGLSSFKEYKANAKADIETEVLECTTLIDRAGQRLLNLKGDKPVTRIKRVRRFDGERVILDIDYLNPALIPGVTQETAADSLFEYIENVLKLQIGFAKKEITVEPVSMEERKLLDLHDCSLLVVVRSYTFLEDATLFGYTISKHRPDRFKFKELTKRNKN